MSDFEDAEGTQLSDLTEESKDPKTSAEEHALIDRFDASQYSFFGKDVTQEVELGGLEDEDDTGQLGTLDDDEYGLSSVCDRDEVEQPSAISEADNMSELFSSFMRMNKVYGETRLPASIGDLGFPARESSSNASTLRKGVASSNAATSPGVLSSTPRLAGFERRKVSWSTAL